MCVCLCVFCWLKRVTNWPELHTPRLRIKPDINITVYITFYYLITFVNHVTSSNSVSLLFSVICILFLFFKLFVRCFEFSWLLRQKILKLFRPFLAKNTMMGWRSVNMDRQVIIDLTCNKMDRQVITDLTCNKMDRLVITVLTCNKIQNTISMSYLCFFVFFIYCVNWCPTYMSNMAGVL